MVYNKAPEHSTHFFTNVEGQVQNNHQLSACSSQLHSDLVRGSHGRLHRKLNVQLVARQFCHNTPVTFWPCQVWCYCPHLTLVRMCVLSETMVRLPHSNWEQLWFSPRFGLVCARVCVCFLARVRTQFCLSAFIEAAAVTAHLCTNPQQHNMACCLFHSMKAT